MKVKNTGSDFKLPPLLEFRKDVLPMIGSLHEKLLPTVFRAFGNYAKDHYQ